LKAKNSYKKKIAVLLAGVATVFLYSCEKDTVQPNQTTSATQQTLPAVVSFSINIVPIFTASCNSIGCHGASSPAAGLNLTPVSAYNSLMAKHETYTANPSGSNLYIEVSNGEMPKPPAASLSGYQQQLILEWITQGASNN
jgi:hypothetical protein